MMRHLVDRWRLGVRITGSGEKQEPLASWIYGRIRDLERVLDRLYPTLELPPPKTQIVRTSASTTINSTTIADITGATITYTPDVDMSVLVAGVFQVEVIALGAVGQSFTGSLDVNGATETGTALWKPAVNLTSTLLSQQWVLSLKSGTAYTIKLQGVTSNALSNFSVSRHSTCLSITSYPLLLA